MLNDFEIFFVISSKTRNLFEQESKRFLVLIFSSSIFKNQKMWLEIKKEIFFWTYFEIFW